MLFATFKRWLRRRWPSTADAVAAEQLACARVCATLWEYRESFADECAVAIMRRHNRRKRMTSETDWSAGTAELDAQRADAARYRWLLENEQRWSWNPTRYNETRISGFSCGGTGYLGHSLRQAVDIAMKEEK